jgi:hypothetical protein
VNVRCARIRWLLVRCCVILASLSVGSHAVAQGLFLRADANADATVDISDALSVLGYLFLGTEDLVCLDAADSNDDGTIDISDATFTLGFLFVGSAAPPAPGPSTPGPDPTGDSLSCGSGPGGAARGYVTSKMDLASTQAEARAIAFDLDGDPEGRLENRLGEVLAVTSQAGLDLQGGLNEALGAGRVVLLHSLQADDLAGSSPANWRVLIGEDVAPPLDLSGAGEFVVAPGAPPGTGVPGTVVAGHFSGGPGTIQIEIAVHPAVSFVLELVGVRIEADVSEDGCRAGRIGGGLTQDEIDGALIPGLALTLQATIEEDPEGQLANQLLSLYDEDGDGRLSVEDLRANSLVASLVAPDVDLLDAGGAFHPLIDGVSDSLSFAFELECVRAQISLPPE